jgi:hypothetical protein
VQDKANNNATVQIQLSAKSRVECSKLSSVPANNATDFFRVNTEWLHHHKS